MFKFCDYCSDEFFAEDTRRVDGGRLCVRCLERGVKTIARK